MKLRIESRRREARVALIRGCGLFDPEWYLASYPDVAASGVEPVLHYLTHGAREDRFPNPLFDTRWYIERYRLDGRGRVNPLIDYWRRAASRKRDPNPYFSTSFYLRRNRDVAKSGMNPLVHFLRYGAAEGRDPGPDFSLQRYRELYPDIGDANPLAHFLHTGREQGRVATPVAEVLVGVPRSGRWMDPASARTGREAKRDRRVRLALFALGCAAHALRRQRGSAAGARGPRLSASAFVRSAVQRFRAEGLDVVPVGSALLLAQAVRPEEQKDYAARVRAAPRAGTMLYVANALKVVGYVADAEAICRDLARSGPLRVLALVTLADIHLVEAMWASEYASYAVCGSAIDPDRIVGAKSGRSWHDRSFGEAVELLTQAVAEEPDNAAAWCLLALAYRLDGRWVASIEATERFAALCPGSGETDLFRARALFGLNETAGLSHLAHAVRGSRERLSIGVARIVEDPSGLEPSRLLALKPAVGPANVDVAYTLVARGRCVPVHRRIDLPEERLLEVGDAQLLPEYGAVLAGGDTLIASMSHMRRCHDVVFTSGLQAVANGYALYCTGKPSPADAPVACFIGNNDNYFHWLLEDVPRTELLVDSACYGHLPILVRDTITAWQLDLLRRVGVDEGRLCRVDFGRPVAVRHLVLPPRLSKDLVVHPHAVAFLRQRLVPGASDLDVKPGKRLYLARRSALVQRGLLNETEVMEQLRKAGFTVVDPGSLSIDEQIKLFSDVEVIAAPGGAALSNLLFAPAGAKVLALSADAILSETFTSLASALGQTYVLCAGTSIARAHRYWIWTRFDFSIARADLALALEQVLDA